MKNQKGFVAVPILIAIILGILVVGGGTYFVVKKKITIDKISTTSEITPTVETVYQCPNGQVQFGGDCKDSTVQSTETETSNVDVSVVGMSKYTDKDFGFSFWYPITKEIKVVSTNRALDSESQYGMGTKVLKTISAPDFTLAEVYSPAMSILSSTDAGCCGSRDNRYFFDKQAHLWMKYDDGGPIGRPAATTTADISYNTMGGLHIFDGYTRFGIRVIVPLSAHNFLVLYSKCNNATDYLCSSGQGSGTDKFEKSVQTIVATDLAVATPVSADEQIKVIQKEKDSYYASR